MVKSVLLVGLGGGIGSILRYLTTLLVNRFWGNAFPLATFSINIAGCFIIGILAGIAAKQPWADDSFKLLFITGFCGGYTTFSAFALENLNLMQNGNSPIAILYIALSVVSGVFAAWLGMYFVN